MKHIDKTRNAQHVLGAEAQGPTVGDHLGYVEKRMTRRPPTARCNFCPVRAELVNLHMLYRILRDVVEDKIVTCVVYACSDCLVLGKHTKVGIAHPARSVFGRLEYFYRYKWLAAPADTRDIRILVP